LRINAIVDDHIAVAVALVFAKLSNTIKTHVVLPLVAFQPGVFSSGSFVTTF
jgi:hypothetical protein